MSEGSGLHQVKPESQSIKGCAELREKCQEKTFEKMDKLHNIQMTAIGNIDKKIAFMDGVASASNPKTNSHNKNGSKDILIKFLITWGPPLGFIIALGFITWLKSKGWL